jgi:hypothetical protein
MLFLKPPYANKIEHRNTVAYGGFKKSISGYTRNRLQNPTIKTEIFSCKGFTATTYIQWFIVVSMQRGKLVPTGTCFKRCTAVGALYALALMLKPSVRGLAHIFFF